MEGGRKGDGAEGRKWSGGEVSDGSAWMEWKEVEGGRGEPKCRDAKEKERKRGGERQSSGGKDRK